MKRLFLVLLLSLGVPLFGATRKVELTLSANPTGGRAYVSKYMDWITTQGFTSLQKSRAKNAPGQMWDYQLEGSRKGIFGYYEGNTFKASHGDSEFAHALSQANYQIDYGALNKGIQSGHLAGSFLNRLLIQEELLGKIAVSAGAFKNANSKSTPNYFNATDESRLSGFITNAQQYYRSTRYLRSGFSEKKFTAPDLFVGVIIMNSSSTAFKSKESSGGTVYPNEVGLIVPSGNMTAWTNTNTSPLNYFTRQINLTMSSGSTVSVSTSGKSSKGKSQSESLSTFPLNITLTRRNNVVVEFNKGTAPFYNQAAFFEDLAPWALILEFSDTGYAAKGLAKLNIADFGYNMKIGGMKDMFYAFTFKSVLDYPYKLYQMTYSQRSLDELSTTNYPFVYSLMQGIFNGYLEVSGPKPLVTYSSAGIGLGATWPQPTQNKYFASNSNIDWKPLRALLITKAIEHKINLRKDALTMDVMTKIVANPSENQSTNIYAGQPASPNASQTYGSTSWQHDSSSGSKSHVETVYLGATKNYIPVVKAIVFSTPTKVIPKTPTMPVKKAPKPIEQVSKKVIPKTPTMPVKKAPKPIEQVSKKVIPKPLAKPVKKAPKKSRVPKFSIWG
jgi:hypothetical protein